MKLRNKKTGKIRDFELVAISKESDELIAKIFSLDAHHAAPVLICRSIAELNEEWEDYEPKEPLIKDEKIRKAVRAWAEALNASEVNYNSCAEYSEGRFEAEMGMADIDFGRVIGLKDDNYTIAELCGEEEE